MVVYRMKRMYKKYDVHGNLFCVGTGAGGIEITEEEYNTLLAEIQAANQQEEPDSDEISDAEALNIILGVSE